ncbi:GSCFA domain-containing protein [Dyadobacter sp. NIV53]|uniref:GSCFA domain-containing protein n=1 Tax=Dyadobacter sp. NIV53 TaxID=2861765 RepID=UPI001C87829B|nr:GSCFA domain-containing protein [Dyadobacter sp. NIV53]
MKQLKLNTEVSITPSDWKINHHSKILTIGSCFAEVLGRQLFDYKFPVLNNPFGTVFNPHTITKILDSALEGRKPNSALYLENADRVWLHHDFHSAQWAVNQHELETELMEKLNSMKAFIQSADLLVITLGTAYAYRHRSTNLLVGNCHKLPSDRFVKELLHPDQIMIPFEQLINKLRSFRRDLQVIVTVSPVRHTKDTLPLNQVSKSTLRLICHRLSEKYRHVEYFPSYEIMIDELRDYRYYEEDLIHPNKIAEDHIFHTFVHSFVSTGSLDFMKEWNHIRQMMNHRPQHGFTQSQFKLLNTLRLKLNEISATIDVTAELNEIRKRINEFPVL